MKFWLPLTLLALFGAAFAVKVDYTGHMVIRIVPETKEQLDFLRKMQATSSADFWALPANINQPADLRVSPVEYYFVARTLAEQGMSHTIHINDIGELEHQEQRNIALRRAVHDGKAFDFQNYHTYEEVMAFISELTATNPFVTSKNSSIVTAEGRSIPQVTISSGGVTNKQVIFFDCNIHAREWITNAVCVWIINQLATGYGNNAEITRLIDTYDWKFIPISNPDGYAYTWNTDRLWRKNRVAITGSPCIGVDCNRNFPVGFGNNDGSSGSACSETYRGTNWFSENESRAIRDFAAADRGKIKAALSIHSYSQLWLSPNGYTVDLPVEYNEMLRVMKVGVDALSNVYGTPYIYGNSATTIYIASGITTDYYYQDENIIHSYTLELRDQGVYGFELPPNQIDKTAEETWAGIKAFVEAL